LLAIGLIPSKKSSILQLIRFTIMLKLKYLIYTLLICLLATTGVYAQKGKPVLTEQQQAANLDSLRKFELRLQAISDTVLDGTNEKIRINPTLVKALKIPGSFDYPFDSLKFMKKLIPPDRSFALYNWVLKYDDATFRYYGAIQMNNKDSLVLLPLRDFSEKLDTTLEEVILPANEWFGALYYTIFESTVKGKKYYMLLGWDGNNRFSDKKIIEVLSFDKKTKKPVFGAPVFEMDGKIKSRIIFEYSGEATMLLNYIPDHKIITFDNLVPPNPNMVGKFFTYVPDGDYNYFIFKKGKWLWQEELFKTMNKRIKEAGDGGEQK
jgi:hypothetical protein